MKYTLQNSKIDNIFFVQNGHHDYFLIKVFYKQSIIVSASVCDVRSFPNFLLVRSKVTFRDFFFYFFAVLNTFWKTLRDRALSIGKWAKTKNDCDAYGTTSTICC